MARKPCIIPGCPTLTEQSRCVEHARAVDKARGTRQQRGYDASHDQLRAHYVRQIEAGRPATCWRCGQPIQTLAELNIGHDDYDRSITRGPECRPCNLRAAGLMRHGISPSA